MVKFAAFACLVGALGVKLGSFCINNLVLRMSMVEIGFALQFIIYYFQLIISVSFLVLFFKLSVYLI